MKKILAGAALIILGLFATLAYRVGATKPVVIVEKDYGPFRLVYKNHIGAYYKIVPVIEEVEAWAKKNGETCHLSFGEYLDSVDLVAEDRLRSYGGCLVDREWSTGLPEGFMYHEEPVHHFVTAEFSGAPSIGPLRVYPKVKKYMQAHQMNMATGVFELYEILPDNGIKTTYLFSATNN